MGVVRVVLGLVVVSVLLVGCGGGGGPSPAEGVREQAGERRAEQADDSGPQREAEEGMAAAPSAPMAVTFPIEVTPLSSETAPDVGLHLATQAGSTLLFEPQYAPPREGLPGVAAFTRFTWSPSGRALAVIDDRGLWLVEVDGDTTQIVSGHVFDVAWASETDFLAARTSERTLVLAVAGGTLREAWPEPAELLGWSPDGSWLALGAPGEQLVVWHADGLTPLGRGTSAMWLADGRLVYRMGFFDPATGKTAPWDGPPCCGLARLSADGAYAVRARAPGVDLLDGQSGALVAEFAGWRLPLGATETIPVTTDGRVLLQRVEGDPCSDEGQTSTLAVGHPDGTVIPLAKQPFILMAAWAPTGDRVAYVGFYSNLRVVDASGEGEPAQWVEGPVELFRWAPDGESIAYWPALLGRGLCD